MMIIIIDKQQVVNFEKNENFKNKNLRQIDNFVRTTKLATYSHCATKMNGEKKIIITQFKVLLHRNTHFIRWN